MNELGFTNVDRAYEGLGTLLEVEGTNRFIHLVGSYGPVVHDPALIPYNLTDAAQAFYNVFTIQ